MTQVCEIMMDYFKRNRIYQTSFKNADKLSLLEPAILEGYFRASINLDGSVTLKATPKLMDLYYPK